MFEKIIVIGCPGAGKSVFARRLHEITGLPLYHLDNIFWKSDKTNIEREKFDEELNKILSKEKWIIDGNYQRTLEMRLSACDTAFLLDYPHAVCMAGVYERIGTERPDLPWVEDEIDEEFRQFVIDFPEKNMPLIYEALDKHKDKNVIIFKSREESETYLEKLSDK